MPSAERPETSGTLSGYPTAGSFADLLHWHMEYGTRPDGGQGRPRKRWSNREFAHAAGGVTERTVRNWRNGSRRPADIGTIERVLFANDATHDQWRLDLRLAFDGHLHPAALQSEDQERGPKVKVPDRAMQIERLAKLIQLKEELSPVAEEHDVISNELARLFSERQTSSLGQFEAQIRIFSQSVARIVTIYGKYKYYFSKSTREEVDCAFSEAENLSGQPKILQSAQNAVERLVSSVVTELDSLST